jgi:hypothetical protein
MSISRSLSGAIEVTLNEFTMHDDRQNGKILFQYVSGKYAPGNWPDIKMQLWPRGFRRPDLHRWDISWQFENHRPAYALRACSAEFCHS